MNTHETQRDHTLSLHGADHIEIVEVGLRDGLQSETRVLSTQLKIDLLNRMIRSGVKSIEATSFVSPRAVPQLADAHEVLAGAEKTADTCLIALTANVKGAERAAASAVDCGLIVCSASETHNRKNLNRSIAASISEFDQIVHCLLASEKRVTAGIATAFGCPFEGDIQVSSLLRIVHAYADLGIDHITLGDTTGMATPRNIEQVLGLLRSEFPSINLGLHLHNTRGIGLANVLVGLKHGVRRFDASAGGLGGCPFAAGATGNICTEDLVYLLLESGYRTGIDLEQSIGIARDMETALGHALPGQVMRAGKRLDLHDANDIHAAIG